MLRPVSCRCAGTKIRIMNNEQSMGPADGVGSGRPAGRIRKAVNGALGRVRFFEITVSCIGILLAYMCGMYATGSFHSASRWMGAMLACSSVVAVMQKGTYRDSLRAGALRVLGTFIGAAVAYLYLRMMPFTVVGMLAAVFVLEAVLMLLRLYDNGNIATVTLLIIMLVSQMSPDADPAVNCTLRFCESAVGVAVGVGLLWILELWNRFRQRLLRTGASPDGEMVTMDAMPLRWGHLRVLIASSLGQITGAGMAAVVSVVIPLLHLADGGGLTPLRQALLASSSLVGIMAGSVVFGIWSDRAGYPRLFRLCPSIVAAASLTAFLCSSFGVLTAALFVAGLGIGGDYSMDGEYVSEIMPRRLRRLAVGIVKASSSAGTVAVSAVCLLLLRKYGVGGGMHHALFLLVLILAAATLLTRLRFAQSPAWLLAHGRQQEAEHAARYILGQDVQTGAAMREEIAMRGRRSGLREFLRGGNMRRILLSGVPWACEGMGVYGVGMFLPLILISTGIVADGTGTAARIVESVGISVVAGVFGAAGFGAGLAAVRRVDGIRMQVLGFVVAAAGLELLPLARALHLHLWWGVAGFMLFELFINAGPHLVTFVLPSRIYSVSERGVGAGVAAAFGKAGAAAGVFVFPFLMHHGGAELAVAVTAAVMIAGAAVTFVLGRGALPQGKRTPQPED